MRQITDIRKAVCTMADQLKKAGYTLSDAFCKAWQRVKLTIKVRAAGVTAENRQERLEFLRKFRPEDLSVTLERGPENRYDSLERRRKAGRKSKNRNCRSILWGSWQSLRLRRSGCIVSDGRGKLTETEK